MELFVNMDHEGVYTILRSVILTASLVPGMISWVYSFLHEGKKTHTTKYLPPSSIRNVYTVHICPHFPHLPSQPFGPKLQPHPPGSHHLHQRHQHHHRRRNPAVFQAAIPNVRIRPSFVQSDSKDQKPKYPGQLLHPGWCHHPSVEHAFGRH